jgi:hypothetical protein
MQWYERNKRRLVLEKKAMELNFPQFELKPDCYGGLCWAGELRSSSGSAYPVKLLYPDNYPVDEPRVTVDGIHVPADNWSIHCTKTRVLCLFTRGYNPGTITAAALLRRSQEWLDNYEIWLKTKKWPGKENLIHRLSHR